MTQKNKKYLLRLLLLVPVTLTTIYIENLYHFITDDYLKSLEDTIPYKFLLQICLLLFAGILVLIYAVFNNQTKKNNSLDLVKPIRSSKELEKDIQEEHIRLLKNLSGGEKGILKKYIDEDTKTQRFHLSDGGVSGLVVKKILFRPNAAATSLWFPHNIEEWAWEYLKEHPEFLK